ncbi:MAG: hypothetical protein J1E97_04195 [Muribaculaceae bacterium]|nr:hypothetical protein [Muribaculaceae bacterium]
MKKRKSHCDWKESRNAELQERFLALIGCGAPDVNVLFEAIAVSPAPRFYISEERAYQLIGHHRRTGLWPRGMFPTRLRMIKEIDRRVQLLRRADPSLTLKDAVFEAVNSPAPCFYLTSSSVRSIFYSSRRVSSRA